MWLRDVFRLIFGGLLIAAAMLKLDAGEGIAVEAMRLLDLPEGQWSRVARAVQAVAVFELLLGAAMIATGAARHWLMPLGALLAGFLAWDLGRFLTGGAVDCGCFGPIKLATAWTHVWLKHGLLLAAFLCLSTRRSRTRSFANTRPI